MAKQTILTSDVVRTTWVNKINSNFTELYDLSEDAWAFFKYQIVRTVVSNNLTVALKNYLWDDPSVTVPVKVQIGGVVRTITSALSRTVNAGNNNWNAWSSELATKEIDWFVYLNFITASNAVWIWISRIPYATTQNDFIIFTTNEKVIFFSTSWVSTDPVTNIGRFNATLSASPFNWSIPPSSITENSKILQTRYLDYTPVGTWYTAGGAKYRIDWNNINIIIDSTTSITGNITTPFLSTNTVDNQFITSAWTAVLRKNSNSITVASSPQNISWFYWI